MLRTVFLALCIIACSAKKSYDGYQVLRMESLDEIQIKSLESLSDIPDFDFWNFPRDLMVAPAQLESTKQHLDASNIAYSVWIENVQDMADAQLTDKPSIEAFDYTVYHSLAEIYDWIDLMVNTYPDQTTKFSMGSSFEGRDLTGLKIGTNTGGAKRAVYIEGTLHAREWVSPASVMWMTNELLAQNSAGNKEIVSLLEYYDIYILTVANPDGYDYTWTTDRLWRKTRGANAGSGCFGSDPNRNFDYMWGGVGSSTSPCSDSYRGDSAFSESETQAVSDFVAQLQQTQTVDAFFDYHSYGQMVLSPWSHTSDLPADFPLHEATMSIYADAVFARHGMTYTTGNGGSLFPISGDSVDWMYGDRTITHSYSVELRDEGQYGVLLPADQIVPCAEENYDGLVAALNSIKA